MNHCSNGDPTSYVDTSYVDQQDLRFSEAYAEAVLIPERDLSGEITDAMVEAAARTLYETFDLYHDSKEASWETFGILSRHAYRKLMHKALVAAFRAKREAP